MNACITLNFPGHQPPSKTIHKSFIIGSSVGVILLLLGGLFAYKFLISLTQEKFNSIQLPFDDTNNKLMIEHTPSSLEFTDTASYRDNHKQILDGVMGSVAPGQILAIMGGSGAR